MIKITGVEQTIKNLNKALFDMDKATSEAIFVTANKVKNTAALSIQNPSPGHEVLRTRQGGTGSYSHMAADKGNAPNTDTGVLVSSIAVDYEKGDQVAFVGTSIEYGPYLEFNGWPWLEPAMDEHENTLLTAVSDAMKRQIAAVKI